MKDESRSVRNMEHLERKRRMLNDRLDRKQCQLDERLNQRQTEIIAAAMQLLDAEGLNNLSLRKLASGLNMQAPGLYWYFKNKEMLIDYLAEEILREAFYDLKARADDEPWQEWLSKVMNRLRATMLEHTDGARVVAGAHLFPAVTLAKLFELSVQSLSSAGFDIMSARRAMMTIITYTFGFVIEEQSAPNEEEYEEALLHGVLKDYPFTVEAMNASKKANLSNTTEFNDGLQLILKGASI